MTQEVNQSDSRHGLRKSKKQISSADVQQEVVRQERKNPKVLYAEQREQAMKRKEDDNFVRRFVNVGNFIQNQFAGDHRRRLKVHSEHSAV